MQNEKRFLEKIKGEKSNFPENCTIKPKKYLNLFLINSYQNTTFKVELYKSQTNLIISFFSKGKKE